MTRRESVSWPYIGLSARPVDVVFNVLAALSLAAVALVRDATAARPRRSRRRRTLEYFGVHRRPALTV